MMKNYRLSKGQAILQSGPKASSIRDAARDRKMETVHVSADPGTMDVPKKRRPFMEYPFTPTPPSAEHPADGHMEGMVSKHKTRGKGGKG